jgi:TorA maturation chaperone TorD
MIAWRDGEPTGVRAADAVAAADEAREAPEDAAGLREALEGDAHAVVPAEDALEATVGQALGRAAIYRVLGAAFAPLDRGQLDALAESASAVAGGTAVRRELPVERLAESLSAWASAARAADPDAVAEERVFLFDRGSRCPPYEAAWDDAPQLGGKAALLADIAGFIAAFGVLPAEACPDVEDHIATECELMSVLALKEACALAEGETDGLDITRRAQQAFIADHLGRWAVAFAAALREATPLPYYSALAEVLDRWVEADAERLGVVPVRVTGRRAPGAAPDDNAFTCPMAVAGGADEPA